MKRIIAFILAMIMIVSVSSLAFAKAKCNHSWKKWKLTYDGARPEPFTVIGGCSISDRTHYHYRMVVYEEYERECRKCGETETKNVRRMDSDCGVWCGLSS